MFGRSAATCMFFVIQATTALILFTGGNTSFNGFPFLTSFVAEDSFLPRWLTKRGHRLVFSNGIIVLTVLAVTLLYFVGSNVNRPGPVLRDRRVHRLLHGRLRHGAIPPPDEGAGLAAQAGDQLLGRRVTSIVVVIFAVVKFTEGAWLIVIVFPLLVFALIKLNGRYRLEAGSSRTSAGANRLPRRTTRAGGAGLRGRVQPGDDRRAALRQWPAAHRAARGPLRHRLRNGPTSCARRGSARSAASCSTWWTAPTGG